MTDASEVTQEQESRLLQSLNSGTANLSQKATECGECGQPLEEWEAGVCEGCGTPWEQDEYKSFTAKN